MAKTVMIINPTSGKGRAGKNAPAALGRLRSRGLDVQTIMGSSAEDAVEQARQAVEAGAQTLIACGGDGTVHIALQALYGSPARLGIIPVGTGDDIARALDLPLGNAIAAADVIADGYERAVDVARATTADGTQCSFLAVLSAGFDSKVTARANAMKWPTGESRYLVATVAELGVFKPVEFTLTVDGVVTQAEGMLIAVGNGSSYGGGMFVCPGAKVDDGSLDVSFLRRVSKLNFMRIFPKVFKGTHVEHPTVTVHRGHAIRIEAEGQYAFADGEPVGPLPVDISIEPASLQVLSPRP